MQSKRQVSSPPLSHISYINALKVFSTRANTAEIIARWVIILWFIPKGGLKILRQCSSIDIHKAKEKSGVPMMPLQQEAASYLVYGRGNNIKTYDIGRLK